MSDDSSYDVVDMSDIINVNYFKLEKMYVKFADDGKLSPAINCDTRRVKLLNIGETGEHNKFEN